MIDPAAIRAINDPANAARYASQGIELAVDRMEIVL